MLFLLLFRLSDCAVSCTFLKVIHDHRSSVRCLFFDEWHLLSGDASGQVMAWSLSCDTEQSLMTFHHPK